MSLNQRERCLRNGDDQGMYIGKNPVYIPMQKSPLHPVVWVKTQAGIPFVRKTPKNRWK